LLEGDDDEENVFCNIEADEGETAEQEEIPNFAKCDGKCQSKQAAAHYVF
jgi:hypothetical protein